MKKIVFASHNAGKWAELAPFFSALSIALIPQSELGLNEIEEPYSTFIENAIGKARHAARETGLAALADDSGLCVTCLDNMPGIYSARYAGEPKSDARNNQKLVAALAGQSERRAYYYAALVLMRNMDDPQPLLADGYCHGEIIDIPRGHGGFGYDPHFFLPQWGKTMAELSQDEKNRISHRGQALHKLYLQLKEHL